MIDSRFHFPDVDTLTVSKSPMYGPLRKWRLSDATAQEQEVNMVIMLFYRVISSHRKAGLKGQAKPPERPAARSAAGIPRCAASQARAPHRQPTSHLPKWLGNPSRRDQRCNASCIHEWQRRRNLFFSPWSVVTWPNASLTNLCQTPCQMKFRPSPAACFQSWSWSTPLFAFAWDYLLNILVIQQYFSQPSEQAHSTLESFH
jgi:hypothetical protein